MKRILLLGCGCFGVLALMVGAAAMYIFLALVKPAIEATQTIQTAYQSVNEDYPFTPPAVARLDAERFAEFLQIRASVGQKAQSAIAQLEELDPPGEDTKAPPIGQILQILRTGFTAYQELPQVLVEALRACEMSLNEYRWHTAVMLETIIQGAENGNAQAESLRKTLEDGLENQQNVSVDARSAEKMRQTLDAMDLPYYAENLELLLQHGEALTSPVTVSVIDLFTLGSNSPPPAAPEGPLSRRRRP